MNGLQNPSIEMEMFLDEITYTPELNQEIVNDYSDLVMDENIDTSRRF